MRKPPRSKAGARAPLDAAAARGRALKLLSRREHSAAELAFKLRHCGADQAAAGEAIGSLRDAGWQSDVRYAEMLVRNRIGQHYGPLRIRAELVAAGVPDALAREALAAADCDWARLCSELRARRFGAPALAAAQWQKQYRFLASRGFAADVIRAALKGTNAELREENAPEPFADDPEA